MKTETQKLESISAYLSVLKKGLLEAPKHPLYVELDGLLYSADLPVFDVSVARELQKHIISEGI